MDLNRSAHLLSVIERVQQQRVDKDQQPLDFSAKKEHNLSFSGSDGQQSDSSGIESPANLLNRTRESACVPTTTSASSPEDEEMSEAGLLTTAAVPQLQASLAAALAMATPTRGPTRHPLLSLANRLALRASPPAAAPAPALASPTMLELSKVNCESQLKFGEFRQSMLMQLEAGRAKGRRPVSTSAADSTAPPSEGRDHAYWERRRKNNEAAKRSRDARRAKEQEIAVRAQFLEQENMHLKLEIAALKAQIAQTHHQATATII